MNRKSENILRALTLSLGLGWLAAVIIIGSSGGNPSALAGVVVALLLLGAYIGGPITAALLSRRVGAGHGILWPVLALLAPVITLPIIALWKIRLVTGPSTSRMQRAGDTAGLLKALRNQRVAYLPSNAAYALASIGGAETAGALTASLRDPQTFVRAAAADGLAQMAARPDQAAFCALAVKPLQTLMQDRDAEVVAAARRALRGIGEPRAMAALATGEESHV